MQNVIDTLGETQTPLQSQRSHLCLAGEGKATAAGRKAPPDVRCAPAAGGPQSSALGSTRTHCVSASEGCSLICTLQEVWGLELELLAAAGEKRLQQSLSIYTGVCYISVIFLSVY
jgi:hypothetical protein